MQVYLAATPDLSFGDLLRLSLEQENTVSVRLANTMTQMMDAVANDPLQLVILDAVLCGTAPDAVIREVLSRRPGVKFIVVLPENAPEWQPDFSTPAEVLHQPCFISDVVEKVEQLMGIQQAPQPETPAGDEADFSQHNNRALAGFILSSFLRESAAHAAMIIVNGELQLSRGYLEPAEVREIARIFKQGWPVQAGYEIVRYIQLESSRLDYLVYGKEYLQDIFLVLVGDARDPISEMRSQAEILSQMLKETVERFSENLPDLPSSWEVEFPGSNSALDVEVSGDELSREEALQREKLLGILTDMPSPEPNDIRELDADDQDGEPDILTTILAGISSEQESGATPKSVDPGFGNLNNQATGEKASTKPSDPEEGRLVYSLVLLPRNPAHTLDETLQKKLADWLPNLCRENGWELLGLQVLPDHLLVTARLAPGMLPADMVDILRRNTSARIFEYKKAYLEDNPSGDFWAPGYLALNGKQAPNPGLLARFTNQTRLKQGAKSLPAD